MTLTVAAEDGNGLRVSSSDCPTQDCVHTGTITRAGQSIVCLPEQVVVQLTGGGGGGSQSDLKWGRDPEEDEIEFMRRCAREASHRLGPQKKSGMKRK